MPVRPSKNILLYSTGPSKTEMKNRNQVTTPLNAQESNSSKNSQTQERCATKPPLSKHNDLNHKHKPSTDIPMDVHMDAQDCQDQEGAYTPPHSDPPCAQTDP